MIKDLVIKARSYRKFFQDKSISRDILVSLVDCARQSASARNIQPLKFGVINTKEACEKVFNTLSWAAYLENAAPIESQKPSAYIIVLNDDDIATSSLWDQGIMSQTIVLAAAQKGIGACIIASIKREELAKSIKLRENLSIALVIALGYPNEDVRIVDMVDNQYKYYRDNDGVHYVPKRVLSEVLIELD